MRSPNTEQVSEKSKERNYRTVLDIVNFNIVILNTILTIILGPTLLSLLGIIVCGILFYASKRNIPETIVFLLVYPLGWLILLTHGIDIEQNMKYLYRLLDDSHMDVSLYASQALEDIEDYFEKRIGRLRHKDTIDLCISIYYYLRTGIPKAKIKEDFELLLREKISNIKSTHPLYYEIMFYVTMDESYLLDSYIKNRDLKAMKRYVFEKLKKREFDEIKKFSKQEILSIMFKNSTSNG